MVVKIVILLSTMDKTTRTIDVLLFPQVNLLDIAGPVQAFKEARLNGNAAYFIRYVVLPSAETVNRPVAAERVSSGPSLTVASPEALQVQTSCGLSLCASDIISEGQTNADLLIPGGDGVDALLGNPYLKNLIRQRSITPGNNRIISICSGALLLADADVLAGRQATTHWAREAQVLRQFPSVRWNLNQIIARDDNIYTSAGVTTGIDLALTLIRQDCGSSAALAVARELVVSLKRSGGQSQFAQLIEWQFLAEDSISAIVSSLIEHPERDWTLELMASQASTTTRTLSRKFTNNFNTSPMKFLEQIRIRIASDMMSAGVPLQKVAERSGFGDVQTLRRACKRQLNTTLGDYMRKFSDAPVNY